MRSHFHRESRRRAIWNAAHPEQNTLSRRQIADIVKGQPLFDNRAQQAIFLESLSALTPETIENDGLANLFFMAFEDLKNKGLIQDETGNNHSILERAKIYAEMIQAQTDRKDTYPLAPAL
ncbi:MAG: hypothetical protein KDJ75_08970 [Alphaproteobacteria bacterium]|nr:hypothetical protein [Alphaproteobacteria bacterium]